MVLNSADVRSGGSLSESCIVVFVPRPPPRPPPLFSYLDL